MYAGATTPTQHSTVPTATTTTATTTPHHQAAPAGTGMMPHGVKMETYDQASPEVKALIRQLNRLASATTLEEHTEALQGFDEDCSLDTPFVKVQGRERIRVLSSLVKFFLGTFEIEPRLVKISVPEGAATKGGVLDIDGVLHWLPHRPWFLPFTFLLPRDIPIYADVSLGVKAHNDKVFFVSGKNHNLPHVPRLLRVLAGYVAGMAVSIAEPAVINLMDWYRAGVENVSSAGTTVRESAQHGTGVMKETAASAVGTIKDIGSRGVEMVKDTVGTVAEHIPGTGTKMSETTTKHTGVTHPMPTAVV